MIGYILLTVAVLAQNAGNGNSEVVTTWFPNLPFTRLGCYQDIDVRYMKDAVWEFPILSPSICIAACRLKGLKYAGAQYSSYCFCSNVIPPQKIDDSKCDMKCTGAGSFTCGGYYTLDVFSTDPVQTQLSCFKVYNTLNMGKINTASPATADLCASNCSALALSAGRNYSFALFGYNNVCYCSKTFLDQALQTSTSCNVACPSGVTPSVTNCPAMISYTITQIKTDMYPVDVGCYELSPTQKDYLKFPTTSTSMTKDMCVTKCLAIVGDLAVLGSGNTCSCSFHFDPKRKSTVSTNCNQNCAGNATQNCGGASAYRIFELSQNQPFLRYQGCYTLVVGTTQSPMDTPNTVDQCTLRCGPYAAISGSKCVCISDLPLIKIDDSMCNTPCPGNAVQNCGGTELQYSVFTKNNP